MAGQNLRLCLLTACSIFATGLVSRGRRAEGPQYFWPSGHGPVGSHSFSQFSGPKDLSKPTWTWHHPKGRWSTVPVSTSIDDARNVYLTAADGIRKFSPDGKLLWTYTRIGTETINNAAALWDGKAFCITSKARAFAIDMQNGREVWSTSVGFNTDGNYGQVVAHDGVMLVAADATENVKDHKSCCGPANHKIVAVNTSDGRVMWNYSPEIPVWNFAASFVGDGTFIYQDLEGRAHRQRVSDGSPIWQAGGLPGTWTDGGAMLGSNNVVYTVATMKNGGFAPGVLSAFRLSDGHQLWNVTTPRPPNNLPAVGSLAGGTGLSVVQPMGQQCTQGEQVDVRAYDAETGKLQWTFEGGKQVGLFVKGDDTGSMARLVAGIPAMTMPNPFGTPAIDGQGTAYVGSETGHFYGLKDLNGDGKVEGPEEVSDLDTGAAFVGSSGPAMAPGIFAFGDIGQLWVWHTPVEVDSVL